MKKKKLQCSVPTLLLAGVLCLTLAACGAKQSSDMLAADTDSAASAALPVKAMNAKRVDENPYMAKSDANIHHDGRRSRKHSFQVAYSVYGSFRKY